LLLAQRLRAFAPLRRTLPPAARRSRCCPPRGMPAAAPSGRARSAARAPGSRAATAGDWRCAAPISRSLATPLLAALLCAALLRPAAAKETELSLVHVNNADPLAVCNDGSPGAAPSRELMRRPSPPRCAPEAATRPPHARVGT
jgi:hypothetical protein